MYQLEATPRIAYYSHLQEQNLPQWKHYTLAQSPQIFETQRKYRKEYLSSNVLMAQEPTPLCAKLDHLATQHRRKPFHNKFLSVQIDAIQIDKGGGFRTVNWQTLDTSINTALTLQNMAVRWIGPTQNLNLHGCLQLVSHSVLPSKMKEKIFEMSNKTIWTNNKAYKTGKRLDQTVMDVGS